VPTGTGIDSETLRQTLLARINQERTAAGVKPLALDPALGHVEHRPLERPGQRHRATLDDPLQRRAVEQAGDPERPQRSGQVAGGPALDPGQVEVRARVRYAELPTTGGAYDPPFWPRDRGF